jgi:hypothetical protein
MAVGLEDLRERVGHNAGDFLVLGLCGIMIFLNVIGLKAYWYNPKSPEGLAISWMHDRFQPGESVVSLHYSLSYALCFYTSDIPVYLNPKEDDGGYKYRLTDTDHIFSLSLESPDWKDTENIKAGDAFWILTHAKVAREPIASLVAGCDLTEQERFVARNGSFEVMKVECTHP